jgi:hypothetical protein
MEKLLFLEFAVDSAAPIATPRSTNRLDIKSAIGIIESRKSISVADVYLMTVKSVNEYVVDREGDSQNGQTVLLVGFDACSDTQVALANGIIRDHVLPAAKAGDIELAERWAADAANTAGFTLRVKNTAEFIPVVGEPVKATVSYRTTQDGEEVLAVTGMAPAPINKTKVAKAKVSASLADEFAALGIVVGRNAAPTPVATRKDEPAAGGENPLGD